MNAPNARDDRVIQELSSQEERARAEMEVRDESRRPRRSS
jgi:hypothetical protein